MNLACFAPKIPSGPVLIKRFVCQQQRDEIMWHFNSCVNTFVHLFIQITEHAGGRYFPKYK
jgi:hypothetical protein